MALLREVKSQKIEMLLVAFPDLFDWIRDAMWDALEKLESVDGEQPIYTFKHVVRVWGLRFPMSFTFKVKHLRYVAGHLIGERPA